MMVQLYFQSNRRIKQITHIVTSGNFRKSTESCFITVLLFSLTEDTLVVVTADHSHVFSMGGYAKRGNSIFDLVVKVGETTPDVAKDKLPYTVLGYANGPGGERVNGTRQDLTGVDTGDSDFEQQATVWLSSETHGGDDVGMFKYYNPFISRNEPISYLFSFLGQFYLIFSLFCFQVILVYNLLKLSKLFQVFDDIV